MVLNEAVAILVAIAMYGAGLLGVPKEVVAEIATDGEKALAATEGLSVKNVREALKSMKAVAP